MQAILSLMNLGFDFWIEEGKIRYKQKVKGIDKALINTLLADIKAHKQEVIEYLIDSRLASLYQEKLDDISSRYQPGGLLWLKANKPEHYSAIDGAWELLNDTWNQVLDGKVTESDFRQILNKWHELQLKGIEYYAAQNV